MASRCYINRLKGEGGRYLTYHAVTTLNTHQVTLASNSPSFVDRRGVTIHQIKHFSSLQQPNPRRSFKFNTIIELQQKAVDAYPDNPMLGMSVLVS